MFGDRAFGDRGLTEGFTEAAGTRKPMSLKTEPMRVMLMRRGEFADLPASVRLVHLANETHEEGSKGVAGDRPSLSPSLIKRAERL
jgi:hypothetical protein